MDFSLMGILSTIIVGLIVGAIAKFLMPGRDPGGFIITILLGIAGSFVAKFILQTFFHETYASGEAAGWIASILGAILLLILYRVVMRFMGNSSGS